MTSKIRFHLDENVSHAVAEGLRRRGIEVTTTSQVELMSASDEEQLAFASSQNRVLVTHDDDFLALHQTGITHSGIAYCNKNRRSIGEIIGVLSLIWELLEPEEMQNHIELL